MKALIKSIGLFFLVPAVCLAVMTAGCSSSQSDAGIRLGVDIPAGEPQVKLAAVMEDPEAFNGKHIVMKGIVSGQCASLCEFFFKDGVHSATIYPQGFKFPKLPVGRPVTVYTEVIKGEGQIVFSALGLNM